MPAAITEFVDVTVNLTGATPDKFSFGTLMGVFDHSVTANRQDGPYTSVAEAVTAGFTSAAEPQVNAWVTAVFAQDDGVDQVHIGREDVGDANWTATMDAIELEDSDSWYITNAETRADADIALIAAWTEARTKIYIPQSLDKTATAALAAQTAGYNRTALIYHATSTGTDGYLDGAWSSSGGGLNLDVPGGVGIWAYRTLEGVTFDPLTAAEATVLYGADANIYGRNKGLNFTSKGTMASGRFIDTQTTIDWIKVRMEEAILAAFVGAPQKIPYTNAGINVIVAAIQDVLSQGVSFGHLSPDILPRIIAPNISEVTSAVRQTRDLTITVEATLAGAVQKVILTINVEF
jgi:hypothetical protein